MHGSDPDSQPGNLIPKNKLGKRETPSTWGKKEEDFQWEKTVKNPGWGGLGGAGIIHG